MFQYKDWGWNCPGRQIIPQLHEFCLKHLMLAYMLKNVLHGCALGLIQGVPVDYCPIHYFKPFCRSLWKTTVGLSYNLRQTSLQEKLLQDFVVGILSFFFSSPPFKVTKNRLEPTPGNLLGCDLSKKPFHTWNYNRVCSSFVKASTDWPELVKTGTQTLDTVGLKCKE